jgi:HTH-type transcriptional regulator/antitoxin MqsA
MKKLCEDCNSEIEMIYGPREVFIKYKNFAPRSVPDVVGWHCPVCGECEFAPGENMRCIETLEAMKSEIGEKVLK